MRMGSIVLDCAPETLSPMSALSGEQLEKLFEEQAPLTVGLEEEVMLLDPETLDLWPGSGQLLMRLDGDRRFKPELPAAHLEIMTAPEASAAHALAALASGRRELAKAAKGIAHCAVAGVHPFSASEGELNSSARYARIAAEYGRVARRQLVASLQVHVAVGGAERTLSVYNALRGYLPEIAALAANAAIYRGKDTGMASVRPLIAATLPRQGVPPAIPSWESFAAELGWGTRSSSVFQPTLWWWELRPHPVFGTLEVRVPDAQTTLTDAAGVVALVQGLCAWLAQRHDEGERLDAVPTWRIEENRWSAARYGVEGRMADLETGKSEPTRERLGRLLLDLEPLSRGLGSAELLRRAGNLLEVNGAVRQRELFRDVGAHGLTAWLSEQFLAEYALQPSVVADREES
jgi:carboxylate-amine ligase